MKRILLAVVAAKFTSAANNYLPIRGLFCMQYLSGHLLCRGGEFIYIYIYSETKFRSRAWTIAWS